MRNAAADNKNSNSFFFIILTIFLQNKLLHDPVITRLYKNLPLPRSRWHTWKKISYSLLPTEYVPSVEDAVSGVSVGNKKSTEFFFQRR